MKNKLKSMAIGFGIGVSACFSLIFAADGNRVSTYVAVIVMTFFVIIAIMRCK